MLPQFSADAADIAAALIIPDVITTAAVAIGHVQAREFRLRTGDEGWLCESCQPLVRKPIDGAAAFHALRRQTELAGRILAGLRRLATRPVTQDG